MRKLIAGLTIAACLAVPACDRIAGKVCDELGKYAQPYASRAQRAEEARAERIAREQQRKTYDLNQIIP